MVRFIFVILCFLLFQNVALADGSDSKSSGAQSNKLPRAFLPKSESSIIINKRGESISLTSTRATMEEILQKIADERKVVLKFYCTDPSLKQERSANLGISADSLVQGLQQLLPADCRFSLLNRDGQKAESAKDVATVNIFPKECAATDLPVRVFISEREHPLQKKPPEKISLEELREVLTREGPASRRRAADILKMKGDEKGIPYAKEALKDENPGVMFAAANALKSLGEKHGPEKVADAIYERFIEKPYAEFLPAMAELDKDKIWPFIDALMGQSGEKERAAIARALLMTKDRKAVKYLSKIALTDSIENSRQAIYAIGKIGGPEAETFLVSLLREGNAERQAMAVQAVSFLPKGEGANARAEVGKLVKDERVPDALLQALARTSYLEPLEILMKDPSSKPDLKIRALRAMAGGGGEKTIPVMSIGLSDKSPQVRLAAVESMGAVAAETAIPYLIRATEDQDARVRRAAVKGLSNFPGDNQVAKALGKTIAEDTDEDMRRAAVDTLSALGEPSEVMIEILKVCEKHKDPYVAKKAGSILAHWGVK
jgi:HEAT repeat protein